RSDLPYGRRSRAERSTYPPDSPRASAPASRLLPGIQRGAQSWSRGVARAEMDRGMRRFEGVQLTRPGATVSTESGEAGEPWRAVEQTLFRRVSLADPHVA